DRVPAVALELLFGQFHGVPVRWPRLPGDVARAVPFGNARRRSAPSTARRGAAARDPGAVGPGAELVESQRVEPAHRLVLQFEPERPHHPVAEGAARRAGDRIVAGFEAAHDPYDVAEADPMSFARQPIAAARPADADEHAL